MSRTGGSTFPARGQEPGQDLRENAEILRELVIQATRLRFERSDFPVGAYLSGGIDSAVTAAAIRHFTDANLDTFSLRFADAEFDEGRYQRSMVERLGTHHQEIVVSHRDIADVFPQVVWHAEAPILRSAPAPLYLLSKLVRSSGYKVVVTGEGADEVLGGYDIFREAKVRDFWARNPDSQSAVGRPSSSTRGWHATRDRRPPSLAASSARTWTPTDPAMSHRPRWKSTSALKSMLTAASAMRSRPHPQPDLATELPDGSQRWDPLARAQWLEMTTLLPGYILASQGDRMLMANSVEGRFPFLDRDVVDFANSLPARHKLFGLDEKFLLKVAFADLIPEEIRYRAKQPYRAPDAASFFLGGPAAGLAGRRGLSGRAAGQRDLRPAPGRRAWWPRRRPAADASATPTTCACWPYCPRNSSTSSSSPIPVGLVRRRHRNRPHHRLGRS